MLGGAHLQDGLDPLPFDILPGLLTLPYLIPLAQATATNTTTSGCPSIDATSCNYRSVWSILASCGLTLLICVWHAVHPSLPLPHHKWYHIFLYRVLLMLLAFFIPELLAAYACGEWLSAREIRKHFHEHGHKWWTTTHSHFSMMGGFAICDNEGIRVIDESKELLELLDAKNIINPIIAKADIMDKSASDGLGKAILIIQLFWFATQLIVRLLNHLSVTLVELDTICIALLTLLLLFFWWEKPCCPQRPYILCTRDWNDSSASQETSEEGEGSKGLLGISTMRTSRNWENLLVLSSGDRFDSSSDFPFFFVLFLVWTLFGALHAVAWNYEFPTEIEKILWRVLSLALAGSPIITCITVSLLDMLGVPDWLGFSCAFLPPVIGVVARVYLVAGMLASLRSLPLSAYETIPWTNYIPHL